MNSQPFCLASGSASSLAKEAPWRRLSVSQSGSGSANPAAPGREAEEAAGPIQPIEPSICSSISRLSSTAYSIGSSLVTGSMKPLTIIFEASSSSRPRLCR